MGGDFEFFIRDMSLLASTKNITSVRLPMWPNCSPEEEIEEIEEIERRERTEKIERKVAEEEAEAEAEEAEEAEVEVEAKTTLNQREELMAS